MSLLRYKFRAPHLGKYPMEKINRVDKPTTRIDEDKVPRVPKRAEFFTRAHFGDLGKKPQQEAINFVTKYPLNRSMGKIMQAIDKHVDGPVAEDKAPGTDDPEEMAKHIKSLAYFLDSDLVGICEVPDYAWYSHDANSWGKADTDASEIEPRHKYAIVLVFDQGFETMEGASGDDWISSSQSMRAYLRGAELTTVIADYIRQLGYEARAQTATSGQVLQIPLMLLAGMGEMSRIGELVLNPFIGPRTKCAVVTTNLPMTVDKPIDFGLQNFCSNCYKCARECPCQAIPFGDKIMFNGYEIWKPDVENCVKYRTTNKKGSGCSRCMKTCPLNKVVTSDGPLLQRIAHWLAINTRYLKPVLIPIAVWMDDVLGNGKRVTGQKWWLDLVYKDEKLVVPEATNAREIDPSKANPRAQRIAIYPVVDLPPGTCKEAFPVDRKRALEKGDEAALPENAP